MTEENDSITYYLSRTAKKNVNIVIKDDGLVHVSAPRYVSIAEINRIVYSKKDWIIKTQKNLKAKKIVHSNSIIESGSIIYFYGNPYVLKIIPSVSNSIKTDGNEFLICLEIQIGQKYNFTKRLFNYGSSLRNCHKFNDCYSIDFFLSSNQLNRKSNNNNSKNEKILKYMRIIEIDINAEVSKILDDKPVIINNKYINEKGKEYIKLFGIRNWCDNISNRFRIPKIDNVSSNDIFKECLSILSSVNQDQISKMIVDEQSFFDTIKAYKDEAFILVAFDYFLQGKDKKEIFEHFEKYDVNFEELDEFDIKSIYLPTSK